jgi:2,3-bisphosphoglycerate-dependent phosphoglycerate mutase
MSLSTTLYLVRHAQSNPRSTLAEANWPLSGVGRAQASALPDLLVPLGIEHVISSPYIRCMETMRPFAGRIGTEIHIVEELRERIITAGLSRDFEEVLRRSWEDFHFALPECETSHAVQQRIRPAIDQIARNHAGRTVAVCSHGNTISLLLNHLEPAFGMTEMMRMRNPDVLRLVGDGERLDWDRDFVLDGLEPLATRHEDVPIDW